MAMIRNAVGWYTTKLYANPFKASFKIDKISDVCSVGDKKTSSVQQTRSNLQKILDSRWVL